MTPLSLDDFKNWFDVEFKELPIPSEEKIIFRQTVISLKTKQLSEIRKNFSVNFGRIAKSNIIGEYKNLTELNRKEITKEIFQTIGLVILIFATLLFYWRPFMKRERMNLFFGLPESINSQERANELNSFLSESRIPDLRSGLNVIQNGKFNVPFKNMEKLKYVFRTEFYLISCFGIQARLKLAGEVLKRMFRIVTNLPTNQIFLICSRQYILEIPTTYIAQNENIIISLATTNSNYLRQHSSFYLLFRSETPSFMYWYSENAHPSLFTQGINSFDYDSFKDIYVKEHLVWTKEYAKFVETFAMGRVKPIGSILFYPNDRTANVGKDIDCLIFDVTPYKGAHENDFYSDRNCIGFIDSLVEVFKIEDCENLKISIKQKRKIIDSHSDDYLTTLKSKKWKFESPDANLYDLVKRSKCVIGLPYTSAVLVAQELNIPCYYFCDSETFELPEFFNEIRVITSIDEIRSLVKLHLSEENK